MRLNCKFELITFAYVIIGLFAACALAFGIYLLLPAFGYHVPIDSLAARGFDGIHEQITLSWLYIGSPIYIYIGMLRKKRSMVKHGSFVLAMLYVFVAALRLFAIGFIPLTWLFILAIGMAVGIARLVIE